MGRMVGSELRILGAGAHDHGNACLHQPGHALLPGGVGEQGPVAHRAAVDHGRHAGGDEIATGGHQRVEVGPAGGVAGGHEGGHAAAEGIHGGKPQSVGITGHP